MLRKIQAKLKRLIFRWPCVKINLRYHEYKIYTGNYECKKCKNIKTCG